MSEPPIHATAVAIEGQAVLLLGRSGSGKSDLALRLIDRGAELVSDDYTLLAREGGRLVARPPSNIAGRIEVRGVGIVPVQHVPAAPIALLVRLDIAPARLPDPRTETIAGITLPVLALDPHEASAAIKLEIALRRAREAA